MKILKHILSLLLIFLMVLSISSCGSSDKNKLIGTWERSTKVNLDVSDFPFIDKMWVDGTYTYEFSKDNTFVYKTIAIMSNNVSGAGEPTINTKSGTYELKKDVIILHFSDGSVEEYQYYVSDDSNALSFISAGTNESYTRVS